MCTVTGYHSGCVAKNGRKIEQHQSTCQMCVWRVTLGQMFIWCIAAIVAFVGFGVTCATAGKLNWATVNQNQQVIHEHGQCRSTTIHGLSRSQQNCNGKCESPWNEKTAQDKRSNDKRLYAWLSSHSPFRFGLPFRISIFMSSHFLCVSQFRLFFGRFRKIVCILCIIISFWCA